MKLSLAACALALAGCASSEQPARTAASPGVAVANGALQRVCIGALERSLAASDARRMDVFLSQTLSGIVTCEERGGLAHLPPRDVSRWLGRASGHANPNVRLPAPPVLLAQPPRDASARVAFQRACMAWVGRMLPLRIASNGDDPDTAAADAFDAIEECDAGAGFATIPRERFMEILKSKQLSDAAGSGALAPAAFAPAVTKKPT
jgi:hypothetical protein